ncbi:MAG: 30S ribosomal protein S8 [Anaerolineae bacterium]
MAMTDPIADMLTRIRNACMTQQRYVLVPSSKVKIAIARILKEEGYIQNYELVEEKPQPKIRIWLKYIGPKQRKPAITDLKRVSKPGCRVYTKRRKLPWVLSGIGIAILSTSRGIMTDSQARRLGLGGEVLCYVW